MSPARLVAFRVLQRVEEGGFASDLLRGLSVGLDARDAGLASEIVFGCLRFQAQLDFLIGHFSGRPAAGFECKGRGVLLLINRYGTLPALAHRCTGSRQNLRTCRLRRKPHHWLRHARFELL
jgi:hypothetical protein